MQSPILPVFRRTAAAILPATVLLFTGCIHITGSAPPSVTYDKTAMDKVETDLSTLRTAYDSNMKDQKFEDARVKRDQMIFLIRVEIDISYSALEQKLHESRASLNSWADFGELGLAGAGAIATHTDVKTIYATLVGVMKGTRLSIDKNWFGEKATESLINAMRAGRNMQLAVIIKKMNANAANRYTFEEAWGDLISYYQAGTVQGGLVTLAANSGEQAVQSEKSVAEANKPRYTEINDEMTPEIAKENGEMRDILRTMNVDQWRKVLEQIDGQVPSVTEEKDVKALIQKKLELLFQKLPAADRKKIVDAIKSNAPTP